MASGSARPLASITMTSMPVAGLARRASISSRSEASTAQHRQPLLSEMVESTCPATAMASTFTLPKSLTRTPILVPPAVASRWLSNVVLPEPRKPATTTTGICLAIHPCYPRRPRRVTG